MTAAELAWWNYQKALERARHSEEVGDRTGQIIAESSAGRWLSEWVAAEGLTETERPASASPAATSPTAPTA